MNKTIIAELEKLNETYPFPAFELETIDGRRVRVTQRFRRLWGADEKNEGDLLVQGEVIAILKYEDLKDVVYILPAWKRPFTWLWYHPGWAIIPLVAIVIIGEAGTVVLLNRCEGSSHTAETQHK